MRSFWVINLETGKNLWIKADNAAAAVRKVAMGAGSMLLPVTYNKDGEVICGDWATLM